MPRWLPKILARICELAAARRVAFTLKSRWELAALGDLDEEDACDILAKLSVEDFAERLASKPPASGCTYSSRSLGKQFSTSRSSCGMIVS
jgi:hypothetical protein